MSTDRVCSRCSAQVIEGDIYCTRCGYPLGDTAVIETENVPSGGASSSPGAIVVASVADRWRVAALIAAVILLLVCSSLTVVNSDAYARIFFQLISPPTTMPVLPTKPALSPTLVATIGVTDTPTFRTPTHTPRPRSTVRASATATPRASPNTPTPTPAVATPTATPVPAEPIPVTPTPTSQSFG